MSNTVFKRQIVKASAGTIKSADLPVPSDVAGQILDNLSVFSIARRFGAEIRTGKLDGSSIMAKLSNTPAAAIAESGSYAEHADVTPVSFELFKYGGRYSISEEVSEDSVLTQVDAFTRAAALSIARRENIVFTTGGGTTEPEGVFSETAALTTAAANPTLAELQELDQSLGAEWDRQGLADVRNLASYTGPVYIMNKATAATIRALDSGASFTEHNQGQLLSMFSRPVMLVDGVDDIGTGNKPVALVNFAGYVIGQREEVVRIRAGFDTATHAATWDFNARIGGKAWDSSAIAVLQIA